MTINKFDSLAKIKKISVPKLFIHSKNDEIVPLDLAKRLYNTAQEPKRFVEIKRIIDKHVNFRDCQAKKKCAGLSG